VILVVPVFLAVPDSFFSFSLLFELRILSWFERDFSLMFVLMFFSFDFLFYFKDICDLSTEVDVSSLSCKPSPPVLSLILEECLRLQGRRLLSTSHIKN